MKQSKWFFSFLLAMVLCLTASVALAKEVSVATLDDLEAALNGITENTTITLSNDITVDRRIDGNTSKSGVQDISASGYDVVIDLNNKKLNINATVSGNIFAFTNGDYTIKNGDIDVSGTKITGNKHIFLAWVYGSLTIDNATVKGDTFTAYSVLYLGGNAGDLNITNTDMEFKNVSGGGSAINMDSGTAAINMTDSTLKIENGVRGIVVYNKHTLNAKNCTYEMKNLADNAFNITGTANFDNTSITVDGSKARGITLRDGNSSISLTNGTVIKLSNCDESDIMFKHSTVRDDIITVDGTSNIYFDTVTDSDANPLAQSAFEGAFQIPEGAIITQLSEGTYYVGVPEPTPTITPSATPAPVAVVTPVPSVAPVSPAPKTGDESNLTLWIGLMVISVASIVMLNKKRTYQSK